MSFHAFLMARMKQLSRLNYVLNFFKKGFFFLFFFEQGEQGMEMDTDSSRSGTGVKGLSGCDAPPLTTPSLKDGKDGKGSLDEIKTVRRLASEEVQRGENESEETDKVQKIMEVVEISGVHWY